MNILNPEAISQFIVAHADCEAALEAWLEVAEWAVWKHLLDVRRNFSHADGVIVAKGPVEVTFTVFNVRGNNYRLITRIDYQTQNIWLTAFLTHAEYDKGKWKKI